MLQHERQTHESIISPQLSQIAQRFLFACAHAQFSLNAKACHTLSIMSELESLSMLFLSCFAKVLIRLFLLVHLS